MRRKIKWNTVFFWSMILVLAFLIWNQKTIIREGYSGSITSYCESIKKSKHLEHTKNAKSRGSKCESDTLGACTFEAAEKLCATKKSQSTCKPTKSYKKKDGGDYYQCCWHANDPRKIHTGYVGSKGDVNNTYCRKTRSDNKRQSDKANKGTVDEKFVNPFNQCGVSGKLAYAKRAKEYGVSTSHEDARKICKKMTSKSGCRDKYIKSTTKTGVGGGTLKGIYPCCWHEKGSTGKGGKGVTRMSSTGGYNWSLKEHKIGGGTCEPPVKAMTKTATKAATKAAPAQTTKKATISPAKVKGKSGPIPKATTGTDKSGKTVKAAAGGGSGGIDVDYKKGAKWKISVGKKTNSLEFNYDGKPMVSIGSDGQVRGKKCSCGKWNLRDNRMGIPGRNDINLHTDGWARMLKYDTGADLSSHTTADYKQGGFAGQKLYYLKGGKTGVALS